MIRSIQELADHARRLRETTNRRWLFRGQPLAEWGLQPSVHREFDAEGERALTQEFRALGGMRHPHRPAYKDYADWLALMQHYGLPTRLLDWSHSPLTAAFFAVERTLTHYTPRDNDPADAAVWALCPSELNTAQHLKPYIYPLSSSDLESLVKAAFYTSPGGRPDRDVAAALAIESDQRMQVQRGAFTIHGTATPLEQIDGSEKWLKKFVIPGDVVGRVGEEIDALGLSLSALFPDLTSLARDLRSRVPKRWPN